MKEVNCKYGFYPYIGKYHYTCFIMNQEIPKNEELKIIGTHDSGYSNNKVVGILFQYCDIKHVPQGLTKIFPNLEDLSIFDSNLKSVIKDDLNEYKNVTRFGFCNNHIESLSGDLFEGFENLQEVVFSRNELLTIVEPNILDGLTKLRIANFTGGSTFFKKFSNYVDYLGNATLDEVKAELYDRFYANPENVKLTFQKQKLEMDKLKTIVKAKDQEIKELMKFKLNFEQLLDEESKDFTVIIENREFHVHKFLLIARSPTLADILRNNPYVETLNLIDIPVEIFEKVLNFIYTDKIPDEDDENFLQIFAAAGRLKINKLKENIAMKIQITEENAMDVLKLSNKYDHNELRNKSFFKIKEMNPKMHFMDEWASETEKVIKAIKLFKEKEEAITKIEQDFLMVMHYISLYIMKELNCTEK